MIEPEPKNTAPAILAASVFSKYMDPDAIIVVAPSDHVISDAASFHKSILIGIDQVKIGKIVTFGISPTRVETGYGYLEVSTDSLNNSNAYKVTRFVEKPSSSEAKHMLSSGNFLWNAGIFMFRAVDIVDAFKTFAPNILQFVVDSIETATTDLGFLRLNPDSWSKLQDISIDYAVMEKAENLVAVPYCSKWSDLGDWGAVWLESPKDSLGTVTSNGAHSIECTNSLLRSESPNQQLVGLGLDDIIAITMPDAVLVANKEKAQSVKKVVDFLKLNNIQQAEIFPKDYRPWGWFESLVRGDQFQVKRICVKPGASLSLQSHRKRSEHWIVVEGTAKVTIDGKINLIAEGHSTYVPLGSIHRMENPGKSPMVLIEVQIGSYLGEDDIIRYEDKYARD